MRILINPNLTPLWVKFLADARIDSVHWSSIGLANAPDPDIMNYAPNMGS